MDWSCWGYRGLDTSQIVHVLIDRGADPDARDHNMNAALHGVPREHSNFSWLQTSSMRSCNGVPVKIQEIAMGKRSFVDRNRWTLMIAGS